MNTNIKIFLLCPVPEEQKPINEYIGLTENFFTRWTTLSTSNYQKKIRQFFLFCFSITSIFQLSHFQGIYYLLEWIVENLWWTTCILLFFLLIILSQWYQLAKRFQEARLVYEEASWYDGQIWEKPLAIIKNDNLIRNQKIQPIIERIQNTFSQILSLNLLFFFFLHVLLP
jgi:hypothetical protein